MSDLQKEIPTYINLLVNEYVQARTLAVVALAREATARMKLARAYNHYEKVYEACKEYVRPHPP